MKSLHRIASSPRSVVLCILLLAEPIACDRVAVAQDQPAKVDQPTSEPLSTRVTDPDAVLYPDEVRDLETRLEELYRTRDLNFYLLIRSQPLGLPASELAQRLQRATVTKGTGGVILISFADSSVDLFLTEDTLKFINEKQLMEILKDATESFANERAVSLNITDMTLIVLNRVDSLRDTYRQRSQAAPFRAVFWVIISSFAIALLVAGYYFLRPQNLFGRTYLFRPREAMVRFGGGKSGGHSAEIAFSPRSSRARPQR